MKEQYAILVDLKRIEDRLSRVMKDAEAIPLELAKHEEILAKEKEVYLKAKTAFDAKEKKLRAAESDIKEKDEQIKKAQSKMMEVKTNEEYQAAIRENDGQKAIKSKLEDEALALMSDLESERAILKQAETVFKEHESIFAQEKKKLEADRQSLLKMADEENTKRKAACSQLSPEALSLYERVAAQHKGVALVQTENGRCVGCNIVIRPQVFNEILGYKAFHRCTSCGKIFVFFPKDTGPEAS